MQFHKKYNIPYIFKFEVCKIYSSINITAKIITILRNHKMILSDLESGKCFLNMTVSTQEQKNK